jgi:hypothetical protein
MASRKPRPDLLDELMPAPDAPPAPGPPRTLPPGPSRRVVVKIRGNVADQARAAVLFLQGHGSPTATLAGYVEQAIAERLERDRGELNGGEDFPPVPDHHLEVILGGGECDDRHGRSDDTDDGSRHREAHVLVCRRH